MDAIRKTFLAGVGAAVITKEKAEAVLGELVKQGKINTGIYQTNHCKTQKLERKRSIFLHERLIWSCVHFSLDFFQLSLV